MLTYIYLGITPHRRKWLTVKKVSLQELQKKKIGQQYDTYRNETL